MTWKSEVYVVQLQKELFDGFVRLRKCRCCRRKLHPDPQNNYRTRQVGLCFQCLQSFERSDFWDVDSFLLQRVNQEAQ